MVLNAQYGPRLDRHQLPATDEQNRQDGAKQEAMAIPAQVGNWLSSFHAEFPSQLDPALIMPKGAEAHDGGSRTRRRPW